MNLINTFGKKLSWCKCHWQRNGDVMKEIFQSFYLNELNERNLNISFVSLHGIQLVVDWLNTSITRKYISSEIIYLFIILNSFFSVSRLNRYFPHPFCDEKPHTKWLKFRLLTCFNKSYWTSTSLKWSRLQVIAKYVAVELAFFSEVFPF